MPNQTEYLFSVSLPHVRYNMGKLQKGTAEMLSMLYNQGWVLKGKKKTCASWKKPIKFMMIMYF